MKTKIEWADDTENAASGCSEAVLPSGKMDPACINCYARLQSARCASMGQALYDGVAVRSGNTARWSGVFRWNPAMLKRKFDRMKGGHRVFLGSMTDLWHDQHDPALLVALAHEVRRLGDRKPEQRPHLITLTKRADRLLAWQREHFPDGLPEWVWPGVTAGCQEAADLRVPILRRVKAAGPRVVSVEPMTGPVDLDRWMPRFDHCPEEREFEETPEHLCAFGIETGCQGCPGTGGGDCAAVMTPGIGWCIAGGESGAKARPSNLEWFRALRDQCVSAGVPFHFKQWGEWAPDYYIEDDDPPGTPLKQAAESMSRVGKISAGRLLDGRTWDEVPHV
jgi:protein gp37